MQIMNLKIVYSNKNMTFRLINVNAKNSDKSSNRCLATWMATKGTDLRWTHWNNDMRNEINPYKFNRWPCRW